MSLQQNNARNPLASMRHRGAGNPGRIEKSRNPKEALRRLLGYLAPFRIKLVTVSLLVIIYTALGLAGPYLIGVAIDQFIAAKNVAGLEKIALLMLLVYLFFNLFQLIAGWIMASLSQTALKQLSGDLFAHIQTLPVSYFDRNPSGGLMSRLTNDIDAINQAVSQNVTSLIASVLSLAGVLVVMFLLDAWLALASLLVIPLMIWFTRFVARYTRKGFRELQKQLGEMNSVTEEAISGLKVIKAFRRQAEVIERFRIHNDGVFKAAVEANSYALLLMPLTNVLGNLFVIVIAGFGGWLALKDLVSVGVIATFIIYGQNLVQPLRQLANMYNAIQAALAGSERIFEILDIPSEFVAPSESGPPEKAGTIRFDQVSFAYDEGTPVVRNMTFTAEAGKTIALVGPTGAGKTTIINLLTRFYELQSGSITIDGTDIRRIGKEALRRKLGLVLQDTFLFSGTVLENIRFGQLNATDDECIRAAELAEADPFIRLLPQGYNTVLSERAGNLSQGQRQLLAITRVILLNPDILILDEATSSIDTRTELRIQKALLRLMAGRTSFVIVHRLSTIRDADLVLVIDNGTIVEQGTHQELLEHQGVYFNLYMSQFKGVAI
ncbi:ABC transporter ATP-binding protein [Chlorobium phaeobacteroides]|uniref:ABC transporter related protein n=1 Tax=Chlorobium phaeobacteroides (strain DSM 266 / SMG 266 / 2430) TaxID=290317 RepID=A1BER5_CHLPD|nr:ABC transporter ATP-binding protein [Chlorobium phaeobacteroides]ABL64892.1 ABC transporter related protein [Chlorobium phaeobacteroides DSM 266]